MPASLTVLFVCVGNLCRSPLAERLLRARLEEFLGSTANDVTVMSAGLYADEAQPMEERAAAELARRGLTHEMFRSRRLTAEAIEEAGLILTATRDLRTRVLDEVPSALRRAFTITEFAALVQDTEVGPVSTLAADAAQRRALAVVPQYDVPDPVGASPDVHRAVADLIDDSVSVIARALAAAIERSRSDPSGPGIPDVQP